MIVCPNCGASNERGSRFCENCGADLRSLSAPPTTPAPAQPAFGQPRPSYEPPTTQPPPTFVPPLADTRPPWELPPTAPDWRMSSLPSESPPPRKRRTWLWILLGLIGAVILCCCAFSVWAGTVGSDTAERWFETEIPRWLTETSATREAK